jgi:hypothetical protein
MHHNVGHTCLWATEETQINVGAEKLTMQELRGFCLNLIALQFEDPKGRRGVDLIEKTVPVCNTIYW